ncbi:hypothetical protein IFM89_024662 [Coptis chinensis]|uniref:ferric-chelate reductase (NADH) n=1 Tax=Coptis chinensis TaxID=261450 RepID=A0A835IFE6_9MAGN|nr:hypothetical protein IFM89_024662 [Coptis chinensis]
MTTINIIRTMIKLLLLVVFLGIVMIWIMTPTKINRQKWLPSIRAKTNSTYFGIQGATILEYTFPMLFIAVLGCVYLHLAKKSKDDQTESPGKKNALLLWKRPVLVKGPLGVVSWIELAFSAMFIALLVWSFGTYLQISFSNITTKSAAKNGEEVWEAKLDSAALRLGLVGNICLAFLFFPVTRGSSLLPLVGITSESSIKYHIWLGHIVMTLFTAHGLCYIVYWAATNQISEMIKWDKIGVSNVAGELALLAGLAMWATTFPRIRRKMFELFFYTHNLYTLFLFFFVLHVGISYACIMLPGVYLFLIDRYLRFLQSRQKVRLLSSRLLPCETIELNFSKSTGLKYSPTSIIFINVPSISKLQWHPFTITSSSNLEPEKLSIVIKKEGTWSQKLYQILSTPSVDRLDVTVEGPYGPISTNFLRRDSLVMVSGGSGITPFISIIRELISKSTTMKTKPPQILLVCAFKNTADLTMLDLLLPLSGTPSDISNVQLQIEAYVTREKQNTMYMDNKNLLRTKWFKPNVSDQPISAILGSNGWLWLGAIISCSFVIFLILLGIITRYYIYPIDHNTNKIYSTSARALINMLLICVCIAITCSAVVFKHKKRNAREAKQIQNIDAPTPMTSPSSWFHTADRELESLPTQSLVQATNVHYGSRPDLKKILFAYEGPSVGVLVSGPKQMRHDVATIRSSGTLLVWIMNPTKLYWEIWRPSISAKAKSTYFGQQGPTLLEFMFPMLFIASLGCVYHHLTKKSNDNGIRSLGKKNGLVRWKRPALVKGPLGVVSWIELTFSAMFLTLLVWSLGSYLQVAFSQITVESAAKHGEQLWESKLESASLRLGLVGNICLAFLFFPVARGSSILPLVGLTSESSIKYHIWLGHIVMVLLTAHGLGYVVYWAATEHLSEMLKWEKVGVSNVAGEMSLLAGLAMWATTFPRIRRKMFELFFYTHYLYILFLIFFVLHVGIAYSCLMFSGVYLFLIDRYLRFLQSRQKVRLLSSRLLPCQTVELNFSKSTGLEYSPTSIIFINVPSISKLQWHPFTISSNTNLEPEKLSIIIKKEGSWSQKLYQILSSPSVERLEVAVEGPYGPTSTDFQRHESLVMVSGGSGITPFFSIIRELIFKSTTMKAKLPKILLICCFKNSADLTMLDLLLPVSGTPSDISHVELKIEAYVTQDKQNTISMDNKNCLRTIWFKPNASDQPISAILGSNSWLWLAGIICSSFVIFLVLLGIITRYYIYPLEHNTQYSTTGRALINMLLICVCIAITSSAVVFKQKKRNTMEAKQVQNLDAPTARTSLSSSFHNSDRELESLPRQSLAQATNVNYGSRPDLKKILYACEGSSVGVLVSGPRQMRHEVANICSSGLADNLEFESISFSW